MIHWRFVRSFAIERDEALWTRVCPGQCCRCAMGLQHRLVTRETAQLLVRAVFALSATYFASPLRAEVLYETEITGTDDEQLVYEMNSISRLVTLEDKPPQSNEALRRRAEEDLPRLKRILEGQGYWEGNVD